MNGRALKDTTLIGQHEQVWKLAREELETIDVGNEKN
jgi:hypothetical protein